MALLSLSLLLVACGYKYDDFAVDYADAACGKLDECNLLDFYGGSYDSCVDYYTALTGGVEDTNDESCPNYDPAAAADCVDDWTTITCAQLEDGQTPSACDLVCSAGTASG